MRLTILLLLSALICSDVSGSGDKTPQFGTIGCSECTEPGHFCGVDGVCHEFSCKNFYQYADHLLTGYADNTNLECFGYADGDEEFANGVIYGCKPHFPLMQVKPGNEVTKPFNKKCTAEQEGGSSFECYEFEPNDIATDFDAFEREAESSFPDCEEGLTPNYYYIIASSSHLMGVEGLQGNPIVTGGADADWHTIWQTNENHTFSKEIAMKSMYAKVVVGGPTEDVFLTESMRLTFERTLGATSNHTNVEGRPSPPSATPSPTNAEGRPSAPSTSNIRPMQRGSSGRKKTPGNSVSVGYTAQDSGAAVSWSQLTALVGFVITYLL